MITGSEADGMTRMALGPRLLFALLVAGCGVACGAPSAASTAAPAAPPTAPKPALTPPPVEPTAGATTAVAPAKPTTAAAAAPTTAPAAAAKPAAAPLSDEIVVFAASSLTDVFQDVAAAFQQANPNARLTFNFGASNQLATQLGQGAK